MGKLDRRASLNAGIGEPTDVFKVLLLNIDEAYPTPSMVSIDTCPKFNRSAEDLARAQSEGVRFMTM